MDHIQYIGSVPHILVQSGHNHTFLTRSN